MKSQSTFLFKFPATSDASARQFQFLNLLHDATERLLQDIIWKLFQHLTVVFIDLEKKDW
jgi:hypothetical protein